MDEERSSFQDEENAERKRLLAELMKAQEDLDAATDLEMASFIEAARERRAAEEREIAEELERDERAQRQLNEFHRSMWATLRWLNRRSWRRQEEFLVTIGQFTRLRLSEGNISLHVAFDKKGQIIPEVVKPPLSISDDGEGELLWLKPARVPLRTVLDRFREQLADSVVDTERQQEASARAKQTAADE